MSTRITIHQRLGLIQGEIQRLIDDLPREAEPEPKHDGGWTTFSLSPDSRTVYVSSYLGDDANRGNSLGYPKRTIAAGVALLRDGFPDRLLLKRGDVWQESLGQWKKSGRSAREPMVVSTYGVGPRPRLETPGGALWTNGGGGSPATIDNLAILELHCKPAGYDDIGARIGFDLLQPSTNLLIEDCKIEGYSTNIVLQGVGGRHSNVKLRRSIVVDAHIVHDKTALHPHGLYAYNVDGLLIEECCFDHNGWSESVVGAGADISSHNLYIDNGNTKVSVLGNIIANASSHGMQLRCGGVVSDNLFVGNSIALSVGGGDHKEPEGVRFDVLRNVILEGKDIDEANPRGWGIWLGNIKGGSLLDNILAHNHGKQPQTLWYDYANGVGVKDLADGDNIFFNWDKPVSSAELLKYVDPMRSIGRYSDSIGGDFMALARTREAWRPELTAAKANEYFRAGFEETSA